MSNKCIVGSIREVHRRLNAEGYAVSEGFLRRLVKEKSIPAVYVGAKAMISFDQVVLYLEGAQRSA